MRANNMRASFLLSGLLAGVVCLFGNSPAWGQAKGDAPKDAQKKERPEAKKGGEKRDAPAKGVVPGAKAQREEAKGAAPREAKPREVPKADDAKRAAKGPPEGAREKRGAPREAAKDAPPVRRDADARRDADDARDKRDAGKARDVGRDAGKAPDAGKVPREGAGAPAKDAREAVRDRRDIEKQETRRDDTPRDQRQAAERTAKRSEARREQREFRAENIRSADIGLRLDVRSDQGLVISDVASSGAIAKVGFRGGDRIVSVNGQRVAREADFISTLFAPAIRTQRVEVIVVRGGREVVVYVVPAVLVEAYSTVVIDPLEEFGIVIDDRYADRVVVLKVIMGSPAFHAGLQAGDVITTFADRRITTVNELTQVLSQVRTDQVTIGVHRNEAARQLQVDLSRRASRVVR